MTTVLRLTRVLWIVRRRFERDPVRQRVLDWFIDNPLEEVRYAYPLDGESVVLDLGGYRGDWTREIVRRYDPYVHVFEPVEAFAKQIATEFRENTKVSVHDYGLSDHDHEESIMLAADASSTYIGFGTPCAARFRHVSAFFREAHLQEVSLIKINIEGGEYPLLKAMITDSLIVRCRDIQVQFHDFVPDAETQRAEIRRSLAHTHVLTYDYPFVWENWRRKADILTAVDKGA